MEIKQSINIYIKKNDFTFCFSMPLGATWGNALDAAFDVAKEVNALSSKSIEESAPKDGCSVV
jgi:hypothetical protein